MVKSVAHIGMKNENNIRTHEAMKIYATRESDDDPVKLSSWLLMEETADETK